MSKVILFGNIDDPPLELVKNSLLRIRNVDVLEINQKNIKEIEIDISVSDNISGSIGFAGKSFNLSEISGVYLRPFDWEKFENIDDDKKQRCLQQKGLTFVSWSEITPALVINRYSAMASNGSKPYQASIIKTVGFKTPPTIITTSPKDVEIFCEKHGDVIYKSVSGVRSIVSKLTADKKRRLEDIKWVPTQFQKYIGGVEVRVHVVGDEVICTKILTEAVDYRYAKRNGKEITIEACDIPDDYKYKCIRLARKLGLTVAGIDLKLSQDGDWYCFEVNPTPGFTFYQGHTGQDIAGAIANLLLGEQTVSQGNIDCPLGVKADREDAVLYA